MYRLESELDGSVIHIGTLSECNLILTSFATYGIRSDKFLIVKV